MNEIVEQSSHSARQQKSVMNSTQITFKDEYKRFEQVDINNVTPPIMSEDENIIGSELEMSIISDIQGDKPHESQRNRLAKKNPFMAFDNDDSEAYPNISVETIAPLNQSTNSSPQTESLKVDFISNNDIVLKKKKKHTNPYKLQSVNEMKMWGITKEQIELVKKRKSTYQLWSQSIFMKNDNYNCAEAQQESSTSILQVSDHPVELIDKLVFSEKHWFYIMYKRFIILLHVVSSIVYAQMSAFRIQHHNQDIMSLGVIMNLVEVTFAINILANCFKEYTPDYSCKPIREFKSIFNNYYQTTLMKDIIPLVPLQLLHLKNDRQRLFYLIKIIRIQSFLKYYGKANIRQYLKQMQMNRIEALIKADPIKAMDKNQNLTRSGDILILQFCIRMIELTLVIFSMAYMCGIVWIVQCEAIEDFYYDILFEDEPSLQEKPRSFLSHYKIIDKTPLDGMLISSYFALTSLTTIGFGDFVPQNSTEQLICSFMLLFGVAIFSYMMNNFLDLINQYKLYVGEYDEGDELNKFFGTMRKFNGNHPLNNELAMQIENYFNYRWIKFKNQAFQDHKDKEILEQMPESVQVTLYKDYLYQPFLSVFDRNFTIRKLQSIEYHSYHGWQCPNYIIFMIDLLQCLEPRIYLKNELVVNELEEHSEVIYFTDGQFDIGFEVNGNKFYVTRYYNSTVKSKSFGMPIGQYGCTFNKQSRFIYQTACVCDGYFIRKTHWQGLLYRNSLIAESFKLQIQSQYFKIVQIIKKAKDKEIKKQKRYAHIDEIKYSMNLHENGNQEFDNFLLENAIGGCCKQKQGEQQLNEFEETVEKIEQNLADHVECITEGVMEKYEGVINDVVELTEQNQEINYKFIDKCLELDIAKSEIQKLKNEIETLKNYNQNYGDQ